MQDKLHPVRYHRTMTEAIGRLESIADDTERPELLALQFDGMTQDELVSCRERLGRLESVITAWAAEGRSVFDAENVLARMSRSVPAPFFLDGSIGEKTTYIHFGRSEPLSLADRENAVEGFYIRKPESRPVCEVTFVCGGPAWHGLEARPYREALRCASRTAWFEADIGKTFPEGTTHGSFDGDLELIADGVLERAVAAASIVLAILSSPQENPATDSPTSIN